MVKLEKNGDSTKVNLSKGTSAKSVSVHVNLTWKPAAAPAPAPKKGGLFGGMFGGRTPAAPAPLKNEDLDLGCMWLDNAGGKNVVQALGKAFGSKDVAPYIYLDGDDRSGNAAGGENLYITRPDAVRRVLIFAYIYEGSAFANVDAKITIKVSNGETIEIDLDAPSRERSFCAAALIEIANGEITVRKENTYHGGHQQCDQAYGFGFNWTQASKD
jgi:tellurite resistance protein TerA